MNKLTRPALHSVSSHQGFADSVAAYFLSQYGRDPLALADGLILLPNNRAVRAIEEAFVRQTGKGLLLPRLVTVGDLDLNEKSGLFLHQYDDEKIAPPIDAMQRIMLLANLIEEHHKSVMDRDIDAAQALKLSMDLAQVIDQLDVEEIAFEKFSELSEKIAINSEADLAIHWQKSYALFENIYYQYRAKLEQLNLSTMVVNRNAMIRNLANNLEHLSHHPFIAAIGITTAAPAIAYLQKKIATAANGLVILPHIDQMMDDATWDSLGPHEKEEGELRAKPSLETHPQFHLKLLLDTMGFDRSEVTPLGDAKVTKIANRKDQLVSHIFAPARQTAQWQSIEVSATDFNHLKIMTNNDSAAEAQAVAILVRKNLEINNKRIAIITPDRELARRISAHLLRWNIKADDSAGVSLSDTPSGSLFLTIAQNIASGFAPIDLLSLLKHPLARKGEGRIAWLEKIRSLDMTLRGPRSGQGLASIQSSIKRHIDKIKKYNPDNDKYDATLSWWLDIEKNLAEISDGTPRDLLESVRKIADFIAGDEVWKGDAGRELSRFYTDIISYIDAGSSNLSIEILPQYISILMDGYTVRSAYGNHPRVSIYGLLEARLQRSDLVICAGLNEGSWPQAPNNDPWLSPGIRRDLGLPSLSRSIGLSAHDLAEAIGAKELILSRSERDSGGPAVTSRFLLRLIAFAGNKLKYEKHIPQLVVKIDDPGKANPALEPAPKPNAAQRKVDLSVTNMDQIKADPFAFYAKKIMGLSKLDQIDEDVSAAWRGTMIHEILEKWAKEDGLHPDKLMARTHELLSNEALHPTARLLWQPRLIKQMEWIDAQTRNVIQTEGRKIIAAETKGEIEILGVKLRGVADRIDLFQDGRLAIIDYKSGAVPSMKQIKVGFAMQLGLLGLLAEKAKFKTIAGDIINGEASAFEYWSLAKNKQEFGNVTKATRDALTEKSAKTYVLTDEFVAFSEDNATQLIREYILGDKAFEARLHPEYAPYNDYEHLSRLMEWYGRSQS